MTTITKRITRMEMLTASELHYWAGAGALILTILALCKRLNKPIRRFFHTTWQKTFGRDHAKIFHHLDTMAAQLFQITEQIKPTNGDDTIQEMLVEIINKLEDNQALTGARLNADHQAIFLTDKEGKVTKNNRRHSIMTGFTFEELKGDGWINVIHPDDRELVKRKWDQAVIENREFSESIRYVTHNGNIYNVHVDVYRQLDSKHRLRGYLGVVHHEGSPESPQNLLSGGEIACGAEWPDDSLKK
jgi:PAS domain S-box-containing protein